MKVKNEIQFMQMAIDQAKLSLKKNDYPVGAVLIIDNSYIDKARNKICSKNNWIDHAEQLLIKKNSKIIQKSIRQNSTVEIYTTLEPCLMCLGTINMNRISKIIYACPDPESGATHIKPENLTTWYKENWPKIKRGPLAKESFDLLIRFFNNKKTGNPKKLIKLFNNMRKIENL